MIYWIAGIFLTSTVIIVAAWFRERDVPLRCKSCGAEIMGNDYTLSGIGGVYCPSCEEKD